jgi:hypothetical protein
MPSTLIYTLSIPKSQVTNDFINFIIRYRGGSSARGGSSIASSPALRPYQLSKERQCIDHVRTLGFNKVKLKLVQNKMSESSGTNDRIRVEITSQSQSPSWDHCSVLISLFLSLSKVGRGRIFVNKSARLSVDGTCLQWQMSLSLNIFTHS